MKRIHCFQHAATEGPGGVGRWAHERGFSLTTTRFDLGDLLPAMESFDTLVVMGGHMNIYQYRDYPWLKSERAFMQEALRAGKKIIGFCLGSQLLADALGARVHQHRQFEIGWFPVKKQPVSSDLLSWNSFPEELSVLHWHGDSFDLPEGAQLLASSEACEHQAFSYQKQAIGFQFHLEVAEEDLKGFIGCGSDLKLPGSFVQSEAQVWQGARDYAPFAQQVLYRFLDQFLLPD
jgi:GMP synthase-like glutamine amidotransferase